MKILIVDDHPLFLKGLRALFEVDKEMKVCGEATDGQEAISQAKQIKPDMVIMDINMPGMNGIKATKEILSIAPESKILALSIHSDKQFVKEMLDAGAVGYLLKDDAPEELLSAIKKVNKGDMYLSSGVTRAALSKDETEENAGTANVLITKLHRPPITLDEDIEIESLSIREREILKEISNGLRNKEIADKIFISPLTVKKHIYNIYHKLNVSSRVQAIEKGRELNII